MDLFENKLDLHCAKGTYFIKTLLNVTNGRYIFSVLSSRPNCKKHTLKQNHAVQVGNKA